MRMSGYKEKEIADRVGMSHEGVRQRLHRLKDKLRKLLGEDFAA